MSYEINLVYHPDAGCGVYAVTRNGRRISTDPNMDCFWKEEEAVAYVEQLKAADEQ